MSKMRYDPDPWYEVLKEFDKQDDAAQDKRDTVASCWALAFIILGLLVIIAVG